MQIDIGIEASPFVVNYEPPTAIGDDVTVNCSPAPGSLLTAGPHEVTGVVINQPVSGNPDAAGGGKGLPVPVQPDP